MAWVRSASLAHSSHRTHTAAEAAKKTHVDQKELESVAAKKVFFKYALHIKISKIVQIPY